MRNLSEPWDYLIVTAANRRQAAAYRSQIRLRRETGRLPQVRNTLVMADAGGRRVGSGGSTMACLREVLRRERALRGLRILMVHAGGDSRRLPAYSPCGKIFVPLPGDGPSGTAPTLFDRLAPEFLGLPQGRRGAGQVVVAAGDALILFDAPEAAFSRAGITALGVAVPPEEAARHGVLCPNADGSVRLYLQKPDRAAQARAGAIGGDGRTLLDIGVMSLDGGAAARLLEAFGTARARAAARRHSIDLYREMCCALGTEATFAHYLAAARGSGSKVPDALLAEWFDALRSIPLHAHALRQCHFLHFGSTRQLISSGIELVTRDRGAAPSSTLLSVTNEVRPGGRIEGADSWVEGCRIEAPLTLRGRNVVVGADVVAPFDLPRGACLDITPGRGRRGERVWFTRYYGVDDSFKQTVEEGATFGGRPLGEWLRAAGVAEAEMWSGDTPAGERTLWNARIFPAEREAGGYPRWRWMLDAEGATHAQKRGFLSADRYSAAEIALLADPVAFHARRAAIGAAITRTGA